MKMKQLTLKANIPEKGFIESLLNMRHSGVDKSYISLCIGLYALTHKWHINKLNHYWNLLEITEMNRNTQ